MRKCRKMISWIMLTVMLATMTPYQALATEVPADSSVQEVQPAAGEEGQEQEQDTEGTIPEDQKDPEENEKTTPTEDPSGVTPGTGAVENDSTDDSGTDNSGTDNSSTDAAIVNENPEDGGSGNSGQPTQEIAAPEEPGSGSSTVPAQEEKKVELHEGSVEAEAGGFTVKAEGMLPEGAELVLTKLSDSTVEEVGKGLDKENQTAVFAYDVTIKDAEGKIWQPEELGVKISISGLNLENKAEVSVAHILDKEEAVEAAVSNNSVKAEEVSLSSGAAEELKAAVEAAGSGDSVIVTTITEDAGLDVKDDAVSFDVDSFSAIIVFTVDFTYEEYTYSIAGKESILLSELFAALNIEQDMSAVTSVEWEAREGYNPNELISIEKQEGDWKLTSLKAFDTKEILIVTADNGKVYKIEVTDAAGNPGLTYDWDIKWGNAADGTNVGYEDDGTLLFHPYDWNYVVAEITVRLTVNVQDENARIPANGVKYVIPKSVFKGWNGSSVDIMSTQLTQTPETATQSDFIYSIEGDNIVITNFSPLAATSFEATFSYKAQCLDVNGGHPDSVENDQTSSSVCWNNYTDYFTNEISPTFSIDLDDDGTPEEESTKNIDLAMMTRAGGQALIYTQPDNFNGVYLGWQDTWGTKPDDADDYFYIMWNFAYGRLSSDRDTQPWKVDISVDEAQNKLVFGDQEFQGELVGIKSTQGGVQGQPFYGYPSYKRSYYNHNQAVEDRDAGYTNISTLNQTTGRFAFSKYTTLGYSYPNTSTPTSGYIFQGGVQALSQKYVGTDYYCAQHFAVLMKYPMAFLQAAKDGGVDLDIDGIKANSTMKMTETWDSGYTKTTDVNSYGADIHVRFGQGGSFAKWGREVDSVSSSHREIAGAQTYLLNGQDAQLGYATSAGGSYRASWQNRFSGRSKTENDLICGQHIVMEDKDIFLHAGQGNYTNSWAPSTSLKAWLKEGDYEFHGFWVSTFNEFEGIYASETWSREAIASKEHEKYKPLYIYTSTSLDGEYQPYCVVDKSSGTIKVNLWDGTNVGEALARSLATTRFRKTLSRSRQSTTVSSIKHSFILKSVSHCILQIQC